jgi:SOS response regulatory protein OraA/RecX
MENENQNEHPEVTTVVDVGTFVETLLRRQDEFEAEVRQQLAKTNARLDEIDDLIKRQQVALQNSLTTINELIASKTNWRLPAGKATIN